MKLENNTDRKEIHSVLLSKSAGRLEIDENKDDREMDKEMDDETDEVKRGKTRNLNQTIDGSIQVAHAKQLVPQELPLIQTLTSIQRL